MTTFKNLKPGDIGKVFLVSNEDDDLWFYVVVTKRISLTSVEVEYNVEYNKTMNNFVNGGFYFPKVLQELVYNYLDVLNKSVFL